MVIPFYHLSEILILDKRLKIQDVSSIRELFFKKAKIKTVNLSFKNTILAQLFGVSFSKTDIAAGAFSLVTAV